MDDCERLAGIEEAIDELKDRALCGAVILVEGKRDREALAKLGITGEIVMTSHQSLLNLSEGLARQESGHHHIDRLGRPRGRGRPAAGGVHGGRRRPA